MLLLIMRFDCDINVHKNNRKREKHLIYVLVLETIIGPILPSTTNLIKKSR